ncbi:amidase [Phlyctema vagabunda]|uniref:Amidase n=1 Tax=Phlyctema vagabunda TaxID=108571 RepID=A0ABR4PPB3_9HELO
MADSNQPSTAFFGYPPAIQAPLTSFQKKEDTNPLVRGRLLVVLAWFVSRLPFLQKLLWTNAGFSSVRSLKVLDEYTERWDPTVIPLSSGTHVTEIPSIESIRQLPTNLPGRYHSAADYHSLYLSGKLTPLAVVESLLPLIRRDIEPTPRHAVAFTDSRVDDIIAAAKASTLRYQAGKPLSIIDGVPTAIKNDSNVKGYRTTSGRKKNDAIFPIEEESTWPVQNWVNAGVIVMGVCNMHEVGCDTTNNNPHWGTPLNPHNSKYYPGGSSGGPAYAVSAGLIPFALGSDGGGSIRIPSSFCGLYGLKTSHGRLEETNSTVTVNGPLAASMADLEIAYRIMGQPNPSSPICSLFSPPKTAGTKPKVLGIYKEWFNRADPSVLGLCNQVLDYYTSKLGYKFVDITLPNLPEAQSAHAMTILAKMVMRARSNPAFAGNYMDGLNPATKVLLGVGAQTPATDYLAAQQLRNMLMCHLSYLYKQHPGLIIVSPTTPIPGWPIDQDLDLIYGVTDANTSVRNMEYVWLANFCGNPAISCPIGYVDPVKGTGKIPVGFMAMGEWGTEDILIEWGRDAEKWLVEELPGGRLKPGNWEDVVVNATAKTV